MNKLYLIGYASGIGGVRTECGEGPKIIQQSPYIKDLDNFLHWTDMITPNVKENTEQSVKELCTNLAHKVHELVLAHKRPLILGGDHTCAVGTWSGVYAAMHAKGEVGLIWIDAHMDSHTPETSESGRLHGMPLASLLGDGPSVLTSILRSEPKLKPSNICLIGIRSFEQGESEFLQNQNVRIFTMSEIKERGFKNVLKEAVDIVSKNTVGYGLSIDIDSIDPLEAPGVDVPEPDGISGQDLREGLAEISWDPRIIAIELVEFDPSRDKEQKTEKLIASLLRVIAESYANSSHKS